MIAGSGDSLFRIAEVYGGAFQVNQKITVWERLAQGTCFRYAMEGSVC